MSRREEWGKVLSAEVQRWSAKSCEQLLLELQELQAYEVDAGSKKYQVEVEILMNSDTHVDVMVSVDDGTLPASISPLTQIFTRPKTD